jgi:hypothetical protein
MCPTNSLRTRHARASGLLTVPLLRTWPSLNYLVGQSHPLQTGRQPAQRSTRVADTTRDPVQPRRLKAVASLTAAVDRPELVEWPAGPAREGQERSHWSVVRRASIAGGIHREQIPARPDAVKDVASRINSGVSASSLGSRRTISGAMRSSAESRGLFTDRPVWASSRRSRMWTSEVRIGRTF